MQKLETTLAQARSAAEVPCADQTTCDRAWLATRVYVEANSDMKVRYMDEGAIETYTPIHTGYVSFYARRVPTSGGGMMILLGGVCRGMYDSDGKPGPVYADCATKVAVPEAKFRGYLNANL
ncbi:hypothetical protein BPUN_3189 [Candidatus Paraburkholderia kirkii]|nr:hypothetical protein BPUN_3189 [Candidatus Paraburkholderia kirkii]